MIDFETAPAKFVNEATFINDKKNRMKLTNIETLGDCALLTYKLKI
jgi:hypothetical protein